jgi:hypothetical protein
MESSVVKVFSPERRRKSTLFSDYRKSIRLSTGICICRVSVSSVDARPD